MYDYLIKLESDDDGLNRNCKDPALRNRGDYKRLLRVHRTHAALVNSGRPGVRPIEPLLLNRLADTRTMRCAVDDLVKDGGKAPGPNGRRLADFEPAELWSMCRALADAVEINRYRPGEDRKITISKGHGRGTRTLSVQNIEDRVVARAALLVLQPLMDPRFSPFCMGFRPRTGQLEALATAIALASSQRRWWWVAADIADAFDSVPFRRFLDVCGMHFPPEMVSFVRLVAYTGKRRGLRQGSPLSPFLFNVYLNHAVDRPFARHVCHVPLLRYADDLMALCSSGAEAQTAKQNLIRIARSAGTPLKQAIEIVNIEAGETTTWLGWQLKREGVKLAIQIGAQAWERLEEKLRLAHLSPAAPIRANEIIMGWLSYFGPCLPFENIAATLQRIEMTAGTAGFEEIPSRRVLEKRWQRSHLRWQQVKQDARDRLPHRLQQADEWLSSTDRPSPTNSVRPALT